MTVALLVDTGAEGGYLPRHSGYFAAMSQYAQYPGGESFEPWQDHEWPEHCSVPATYIGEIGERELAAMSGGDIERFLREHDTEPSEGPITLEMVPPHAPAEGEAWDSTIHHFRCTKCGWDLSSGTRTSPRQGTLPNTGQAAAYSRPIFSRNSWSL